ncbi:hypothetical protein KKH82_02085 [Patescibacteria group bacterium]|nr:hypothetical protein [Patescibacteria group bacterium]
MVIAQEVFTHFALHLGYAVVSIRSEIPTYNAVVGLVIRLQFIHGEVSVVHHVHQREAYVPAVHAPIEPAA